MNSLNEEDELDYDKGIAYFWKSTDLEPHVKSVALNHGVSKVAVGNNHSILLTYDSSVFAVGDNSYGQLGLGDLVSRKEIKPIEFFNGRGVFEIASGGRHSGCVCRDGSVFSWGDSSSGQCGLGDVRSSSSPVEIRFESETESTEPTLFQRAEDQEGSFRIKKLACGDAHSIALTASGHVWSWGIGSQTGHGTNGKIVTPKRVDGLRGKTVLEVACGAYHCIAIVEDDVTQQDVFSESAKVTLSQGAARKLSKSKKSPKKSHRRNKSAGGRQPVEGELPGSVRAGEIPGVSSSKPRKTRTYLSYDPKGQQLGSTPRLRADTICQDEDFLELSSSQTSTKDLQRTAVDNQVSRHSRSNSEPCPSTSVGSDAGVPSAGQSDTLRIHDSHFGLPGEKSSLSSLNQCSVSPEVAIDLITTVTASPKNVPVEGTGMEMTTIGSPTDDIFSTSPYSPASRATILFQYSTDSDPEDVAASGGDDKAVLSSRISTGFGSLGSRLNLEFGANFGKLTSAVVGSVAGMFMPSGQDTPKAVTGVPVKPCPKCGMASVCLCEGEGSVMELSQSNTQVWTWGSGSCGQLGLGDTDDRSFPVCVEDLSRTGVVKVAAGTFHSLALTVYSQVYSWGDNSCGQLGRKKAMGLRAKKVKCFSDVLIWDISAGSHYSLFIADVALNRADVYVGGRQPSAMPKIAAAMTSMKESISLPSLPAEPAGIPIPGNKKGRGHLSPSSSFDDAKERSLAHCRVELFRITMFRKIGQLRSITANSERCCCIVARDKSGSLGVLSELASQERLFYHQLALIWQAVLVPLLHADVWAFLGQQEDGQVLAPVLRNFHCLMKWVSAQQLLVTHLVREAADVRGLHKFCLSEQFMLLFERYSVAFSNAAAFGAFTAFSTLSSDIEMQSRAVLQELLEEKDSVQELQAFQTVLQVPLTRMQQYKAVAEKLLAVNPEIPEHTDVLRTAIQRWEQIVIRDEEAQGLARQTSEFWAECAPKIADTFKDPQRRLLRSSKANTLFLSKAARFSSHTFLLFDDFFLHVQSNKNFQAHSLATVWAEGMDDNDGLVNSIKITTPEDVLLVCAPTTADKAGWLLAINQAVAKVITKTTAMRIGSEAVNAYTGSLCPAAARQASYTFTQDPRYRGAVYDGMWLTGKPHGHGVMHWPDRRHYEGEFKFGLQHGEGVMIFPPSSTDCSWEKYEGHWEDGSMSGHGKMRLNNGDTYAGHWRESQRHGHGLMKCGALSSAAATVYIGEWVQDKKHGYGVMDDIIRGEKYMGMWENDNRHGPGLLVTFDGIYTEGAFVQGRMMGNGVLLCDDDTKYEGEFSGVCQLTGKGMLTLPNGDCLEGSFAGQWRDGIKINGMFFKQERESSSASTRNVCSRPEVIPAPKKWTALFDSCRAELGCHGDHDASPGTAWKCVSISLLSGHEGKLPKKQEEDLQELLNINNDVERSGRAAADLASVHVYLAKALDLRHHPLGQLVQGLEDVFRATYVGMGTHRRLLPYAVSEAKCFVLRLYSLVRLLFPDLPSEEYVQLETSTVSGVANHFTEELVTSSALLHPLLLPRLYPPLFTLYALQNERADSAYLERVMQLNRRSDWALMTYVGMKKRFWLTHEEDSGSRLDEIKLQSRDAQHYVSAVEALRQISTKFGPMEKLGVLKTTFEKINSEVEAFWKGEEKLLSLDDLFPVFHFVVIRARIPNLGSEIHFIDDMVDKHVHVGEHGHMFTTLKIILQSD